MSSIAIVGGAGFVGVNLAQAALRRGHTVSLYDVGDRLGRIEQSNILESDCASFGILNAADPFRLNCQPDVIINLAAWAHVEHSLYESREVVANNVMSVLGVLQEATRLACPVVFTSSVEVYGGNEGLTLTEEHPYRPMSPYAASKVAGEALVHSFQTAFSTQACVVRLTNLYGPWQAPDRLVPRVITQQLAGLTSEIELGRVRDFLFVEDAVEALLAVADNVVELSGQTLNVSTGNGTANEHAADCIDRAMLGATMIERRPAKSHDGRGHALVSSSTRLRAATGWRPQTNLAEGLEKTVEWYRDNVAWWKPFERHISSGRGTADFLLDFPRGAPASAIPGALE